jgi:hypothetical protein
MMMKEMNNGLRILILKVVGLRYDNSEQFARGAQFLR